MITITQQDGVMKAVANLEIEDQIGNQNIDGLATKLQEELEQLVFDYFKSERDKAAEEYYILLRAGKDLQQIEDRLDFLENFVAGENKAWQALMRVERRARLRK